jgi:hypothetical protein
LTQAALEGRAPLRTFGELNAFFAARKTDEPAPPPPPPPAPEPEPAPASSASGEEGPKG